MNSSDAGGNGLVDIHCHALPAVDDGAANDDMGLDMLRRAVDEGVTDVVLTPHYRPDDDTQRSSQLQHRYDEFAATVADADIGVSLHLGAELGFRFGLAQLAQATPVARLAGGVMCWWICRPGRCHRGWNRHSLSCERRDTDPSWPTQGDIARWRGIRSNGSVAGPGPVASG